MGRTLNQNNSNKGGNNSVIGTNPVIRKLSKVAEQSDNCASYGGIAVKTLYFLLMSGVGYVLYLYLSLNVFNTGESFDIEFDNYVSTLHMTPLFIGLGAAILSIILPFIVAFVRSTAPVLGTIYCLCQGALLGFLSYVAPQQYQGVMGLALIITIVLVLAMLAIYATGKVRPGKKVRTVIFALFITSVLSSLAVLILALIPATRPLVAFVTTNPLICIGFSVLGIIIATLFLLCDFETIRQTVENRLPKKYEWSAAFGLAITVIWLYFKILDLLAKLTNTKSS